MIPSTTLEAAARVAAHAAQRRIVLDASLLPPLHPASPAVKTDAPGVDTDAAETREPHPQGGAAVQRIISA